MKLKKLEDSRDLNSFVQGYNAGLAKHNQHISLHKDYLNNVAAYGEFVDSVLIGGFVLEQGTGRQFNALPKAAQAAIKSTCDTNQIIELGAIWRNDGMSGFQSLSLWLGAFWCALRTPGRWIMGATVSKRLAKLYGKTLIYRGEMVLDGMEHETFVFLCSKARLVWVIFTSVPKYIWEKCLGFRFTRKSLRWGSLLFKLFSNKHRRGSY